MCKLGKSDCSNSWYYSYRDLRFNIKKNYNSYSELPLTGTGLLR
jgi:hypothetical protein